MTGIIIFGDDEIFDKNSKIILGIFILIFFVFFSILSYSGYFENQKREYISSERFNGKIVSIKVDYKNHGNTTVKLSDSTSLTWYYPKSKFKILLGDSLVKKNNTIYMDVYRNCLKKIRIDMLNI